MTIKIMISASLNSFSPSVSLLPFFGQLHHFCTIRAYIYILFCNHYSLRITGKRTQWSLLFLLPQFLHSPLNLLKFIFCFMKDTCNYSLNSQHFLKSLLIAFIIEPYFNWLINRNSVQETKATYRYFKQPSKMSCRKIQKLPDNRVITSEATTANAELYP